MSACSCTCAPTTKGDLVVHLWSSQTCSLRRCISVSWELKAADCWAWAGLVWQKEVCAESLCFSEDHRTWPESKSSMLEQHILTECLLNTNLCYMFWNEGSFIPNTSDFMSSSFTSRCFTDLKRVSSSPPLHHPSCPPLHLQEDSERYSRSSRTQTVRNLPSAPVFSPSNPALHHSCQLRVKRFAVWKIYQEKFCIIVIH